jgi:hypothetical protein
MHGDDQTQPPMPVEAAHVRQLLDAIDPIPGTDQAQAGILAPPAEAAQTSIDRSEHMAQSTPDSAAAAPASTVRSSTADANNPEVPPAVGGSVDTVPAHAPKPPAVAAPPANLSTEPRSAPYADNRPLLDAIESIPDTHQAAPLQSCADRSADSTQPPTPRKP